MTADDANDIRTAEDLERVYFRAPDANGIWGNVSAADATDTQFDRWARERAHVVGSDTTWSIEDRIRFCRRLYADDALVVITKEAKAEFKATPEDPPDL
jgi:hypothetical protein